MHWIKVQCFQHNFWYSITLQFFGDSDCSIWRPTFNSWRYRKHPFSRGYLIHSAQFVRIQIPVVVKQFFNSFILTVYDGRYSIFSGLNSLPLITTNQVCTTQVVSVKRQLSAILIRSVKMKTFQNAGKSIIWQQAVI